MAIGLTVVQDQDVEKLTVKLTATGLSVGTKYDVHRLAVAYRGDDDAGVPKYERVIPDRMSLWSGIAHRIGWTAPAATTNFLDYECPMSPHQYFIVPTSSVGPFEYSTWGNPYPLSRGFLSPTVVDFNRDVKGTWREAPGHVYVRSTRDLDKWVSLCVVELDDLKYTARGTELKVMGSQYPVYVADTRESRRGSIVLKVESLGAYNDLRSIVFPSDGAVYPIELHAGSEPTILVENVRCIPLDVTVEQATHTDPSLRFVRIDFVEIKPSAPLLKRVGDNDNYVNAPAANFSISDTTPARDQWVTLTDASTGQYDSWDWTVYQPGDQAMGKFGTQGPHKVRWNKKGTYQIKLRVFGALTDPATGTSAGASTRVKYVTVH